MNLSKALISCLLALTISGKAAKDAVPDKYVDVKVQIGDKILETPIRLGLFGNDTPITSENFYQLCVKRDLEKDGRKLSFIGSPFHRIIPNFMIQGGDFTNQDGTGGYSIYSAKFKDENFTVKHDIGVLSMANAGPNTNGSQFFITTSQTSWLDGKHTVFGRVISGSETVNEIEKQGTSSGKPKQPVKIVDCYDVTSQAATA